MPAIEFWEADGEHESAAMFVIRHSDKNWTEIEITDRADDEDDEDELNNSIELRRFALPNGTPRLVIKHNDFNMRVEPEHKVIMIESWANRLMSQVYITDYQIQELLRFFEAGRFTSKKIPEQSPAAIAAAAAAAMNDDPTTNRLVANAEDPTQNGGRRATRHKKRRVKRTRKVKHRG